MRKRDLTQGAGREQGEQQNPGDGKVERDERLRETSVPEGTHDHGTVLSRFAEAASLFTETSLSGQDLGGGSLLPQAPHLLAPFQQLGQRADGFNPALFQHEDFVRPAQRSPAV